MKDDDERRKNKLIDKDFAKVNIKKYTKDQNDIDCLKKVFLKRYFNFIETWSFYRSDVGFPYITVQEFYAMIESLGVY